MTSGPVVTGSSGSAAGQPAATAAPAAAGRASPSGADEAPGRGLAAGTVGGLMWRAVAAIVLVIVLAGGAGVAAVSGQHAALRELSGHLVPLRLANAQLRAVLTDAGRDLRGYLLTGDAEFLRAHTDASARLAPAVAALRQRAGTARERAAVAQQSRLSDAWWAEAGRQRQVTPRSAAAARAAERGGRLLAPFLAANTDFDSALAARADRLRARGDMVRWWSLAAVTALTAAAAGVAALCARRTARRVNRPLGRLVTVLERQARGDRSARAETDGSVVEIRSLARAVNHLADEADRRRELADAYGGLAAAAAGLGVRIRAHLAVRPALDEAARGLGELLAADHVVVRLTAPGYGWPPTATRWSRAGEESRTERLAALPVDWLLARQSRTYTCIDVRAAGPAIPAEERAALLALAAPAVLTIAYGETAGPTGAVTLARDGAGWAEHEVTAAEAVVAELCRGLLQAQLYERERDLVARLRDLDNAKSDFISTVSHELRTPLTSIAGYVEMLADGDAGHLTSAQGRLLAVIDRNTTRLRALIEDLLILSRIEAGTVRTNRQEVDFGALAGAAATAMSPTAAAAGVSVDVETTGRLTGQADPEQIDRLLMNLLSNAVKFTPGGGQVRVAVAGVDDEVVLRVSDTGMGIPEADRDKLFTKFFRASNATHHAVPGTGLGLAIVRTIVAHHGGHVDLDSAEGVGTTVTVTLPA